MTHGIFLIVVLKCAFWAFTFCAVIAGSILAYSICVFGTKRLDVLVTLLLVFGICIGTGAFMYSECSSIIEAGQLNLIESAPIEVKLEGDTESTLSLIGALISLFLLATLTYTIGRMKKKFDAEQSKIAMSLDSQENSDL